MARSCSGIFPLSTYTTTTSNQEVLKNLLSSVNASEAIIVAFLPDISPCSISINNRAFISIDALETTEISAGIHSLRIATAGTKFQLQVEY